MRNKFVKDHNIIECIVYDLQTNFYKFNHHYTEKKLQAKEVKPDRISLQNAVVVLQLIENSSNRSLNCKSSTAVQF